MPSFKTRFSRFLLNFPGYNTFGQFVFLPFFFLSGAGLEFVMIHWHVGEVNFYKTFKRRQATEQAEARINNYLAKKQLDKSV